LSSTSISTAGEDFFAMQPRYVPLGPGMMECDQCVRRLAGGTLPIRPKESMMTTVPNDPVAAPPEGEPSLDPGAPAPSTDPADPQFDPDTDPGAVPAGDPSS